jgi:hypothetical protein
MDNAATGTVDEILAAEIERACVRGVSLSKSSPRQRSAAYSYEIAVIAKCSTPAKRKKPHAIKGTAKRKKPHAIKGTSSNTDDAPQGLYTSRANAGQGVAAEPHR